MIAWWSSLPALAQAFVAAALFFSIVFLWQFVAALSGVGGDGGHSIDAAHQFEVGSTPHTDLISDAHGLDVFRLLSIRSLLAFALLFSWAGALYLGQGLAVGAALGRALLWGLAGMVVVGAFFWMLPRLTEEGTGRAHSAVGQSGEVYIAIPAGGTGQVRVLLGGQVRFVKARSVDGAALAVGCAVKVVGVADGATLLVQETA
ncbi:MAG: NfeD family protein [Anaerolineae bacterium]|jgi:hypothetical protein